MEKVWKQYEVNKVLELKDCYLSFNNSSGLNMAHEPELAIVFEQDGEKVFAIVYYHKPEEFENFDTKDECLEYAKSLIDSGKATPAFWTAWDWDNMKPFNWGE
jgi:uncharacterized protein YkuJ